MKTRFSTDRRLARRTMLAGFLAAGSSVAAVSTASAQPARARRRLIADDDFRHGTRKWFAELEKGGTVEAKHGRLDIAVPGGATVWFGQPLAGPYEITYTATAVSAGGVNDRVSDLNTFWNARDSRSPGDIFATDRAGLFEEYDYLTTYYVGFGGNSNTTTRMRRYIGEPGNRPLLFDRTEPLLVANHPYRVRIVSEGGRNQYWSDEQLIFGHRDPAPYADGWFALRTVASHLTIRDFRVWSRARCD
jgi:hypothetical protein